MKLFRALFGSQAPSTGSAVYESAMQKSDDLLGRMEAASKSRDVFRALMAEIWLQQNNPHSMVTIYEAVREMRAATTSLKLDHEEGDDGEAS